MLVNSLSENQKKWFVAYTFPKAEKKVQSKLEMMGIESFLPLHEVIRNWSDRKKKLVVPLFPNYIFVRIAERNRHEIFSVKEIVRYVSFDGKPAAVADSVIDSLKNILKEKVEVQVDKYVQIGTPVIVTQGPFIGTEGVVEFRNGRARLVISIALLQRSIAINISANDITPLVFNQQLFCGKEVTKRPGFEIL